MATVLFSWLGNKDLDAPSNPNPDEIGPLARAVDHFVEKIEKIILLADRPGEKANQYGRWLAQRTPSHVAISLIEAKIEGPTKLRTVFETARDAVRNADEENPDIQRIFNVSSGTPAMYVVWLFLSESNYPATLVESEPKKGVTIVSSPFNLYVDIIQPALDRGIEHLLAGLPDTGHAFDAIVRASETMDRAVAIARRCALSDEPVLLGGESGTGKELFARAIHAASSRKGKPFVAVNCGAIPTDLAESILFGHEKGAFSGAVTQQKGKIQEAEGGTLFLDEIGELPAAVQVKLLRALNDKTITRLGGAVPIQVNFRLISATLRNLWIEIGAARFREDLFYRIGVLPVSIPPLRDRGTEDIRQISDFIWGGLNREAKEKGDSQKELTPGGLTVLFRHTWPGNVRELKNALARAFWLTPGLQVTAEDMELYLFALGQPTATNILDRPLGGGFNIETVLDEVKKHYLERALSQASYKKTEAARLLGLRSHQRFNDWCKAIGLERVKDEPT
jgi:DNA-binding NtrC family response regulator